MKKLFCIGICVLAFALLQSCSNTAAKIAFGEDAVFAYDGNFKIIDFFKLAGSDTYTIIEKDGKLQTTIDFVKTAETNKQDNPVREFLLFVTYNEREDLSLEFTAENSNTAAQNLLKANVGDKVSVTFTCPSPEDKEIKKRMKKVLCWGQVHLMYENELEVEE